MTIASTARAETIKYDLVTYTHSDYNHPDDIDRLTGTITVSSTGSIIGTWSGTTVPPSLPADMTMTFNLTLENLTEPLTYPAVQMEKSFLVSNMLTAGCLQRDGVTITTDSIYLHEISTSSPVDYGGYLSVDVTNGAGTAVDCQWAPWDANNNGNISMFSVNGSLVHKIWDENGNASYGTGDWIIATAVPEPATLTLLVSAMMGLGGILFISRRRSASQLI